MTKNKRKWKNKRIKPFQAAYVFLIALLFIATPGCSSGNLSASSTTGIQSDNKIATRTLKEQVFKPPTMAPEAALAIPSPSATLDSTATLGPTPHPSATAICTNSLIFLEDLTIPDGSQIDPGQSIDKRWLVENNGTCNWLNTYRLRLIEGPSLGAQTELALYPALSGAKAVIRILFLAPNEAGAYRSAWQAHSPIGQPFGEIIYIDIRVNQ